MTHDLDHDLRALDPTSRQTNGLSDRALDDLHRSLATPPGDPTSREYAGGRAHPRPRRSRWVSRALPVAAAAAGLAVLAPGLFRDDSADASWTAQPAAPSVDDVAEAGQHCADFWLNSGLDRPLPGMEVALAEQRGDWTYTVMRTSDGQYADCMLQLDRGLLRRLAGSGPLVTGAGGLSPALGPVPTGGALESVSCGGSGSDDGAFAALSGRVGPDVTRVVAHAPGTGDVQATVSDGYFAAWWPGANADAEPPELEGLTLTVTVADGTSYEVSYEEILRDVTGE